MDKVAMKATGALLGFYRRLKGCQQKELGKLAGISPSMIAMFESGARMPTIAHLALLTKALDIPFLAQQEIIALTGRQWIDREGAIVSAKDVFTGDSIFLRNLAVEFDPASRRDLAAVWIITSGGLLRSKEFHKMITARIKRTKFTFFVSSDERTSFFNARDIVSIQLRKKISRKKLEENFAGFSTPRACCLQDFVIYDPGKPYRMFGRAVVYTNGLPYGTYTVDSLQTGRIYDLLSLAGFPSLTLNTKL